MMLYKRYIYADDKVSNIDHHELYTSEAWIRCLRPLLQCQMSTWYDLAPTNVSSVALF